MTDFINLEFLMAVDSFRNILIQEIISILLDQLSMLIAQLCQIILLLFDVVINLLHQVRDLTSDLNKRAARVISHLFPCEIFEVVQWRNY